MANGVADGHRQKARTTQRGGLNEQDQSRVGAERAGAREVRRRQAGNEVF
jgi:hypothetical protein